MTRLGMLLGMSSAWLHPASHTKGNNCLLSNKPFIHNNGQHREGRICFIYRILTVNFHLQNYGDFSQHPNQSF